MRPRDARRSRTGFRLARKLEGVQRWAKGARSKSYTLGGDQAQYAFIGAIVLIGVVLASGIVLVN
jgi:hypothetical protein